MLRFLLEFVSAHTFGSFILMVVSLFTFEPLGALFNKRSQFYFLATGVNIALMAILHAYYGMLYGFFMEKPNYWYPLISFVLLVIYIFIFLKMRLSTLSRNRNSSNFLYKEQLTELEFEFLPYNFWFGILAFVLTLIFPIISQNIASVYLLKVLDWLMEFKVAKIFTVVSGIVLTLIYLWELSLLIIRWRSKETEENEELS